MALLLQSHLPPSLADELMIPEQIIVDPYVITLTSSDELMMNCECGCCFSVILQLPGGEAPIEIACPSTAGMDVLTYIQTLREDLFSPLHSLGLVQTREDELFLQLDIFALDFSFRRHQPHDSNEPQSVPVAFISVDTIEEVLLAQSVQEMGPVSAKRATRESVRDLPAVKADELEAGDSCVICVEEFKHENKDQDQDRDRITRLPCRHVFHRDCIAKWLDNSHVCPLCRFEMPAELFQISTFSSQNPNPNLASFRPV